MGSFISPGIIDAIAHSLDIPKLSAEAAKALAPDVEYRLRELIQVRATGLFLPWSTRQRV